MNYSPIASEEATFISESAIHALDIHLASGEASAMHRVAVGVFDQHGRTKRVSTFETHGAAQHETRLSLDCPLTCSDHVLVACNAPGDLFEGYIPDEDAFRSRTMTVDEALEGQSLSDDNVALPLFGETAVLTLVEGKPYVADVQLRPLMARITLDTLELGMRSLDGYYGIDLFAPDRLLLVNVPERMTFGGAPDSQHRGHGDMTHYCKLGFHGHMCLGTSGVSGINGRRHFKGLSLYAPACDGGDADHPLMLAVQGQFSPFGPGQMQIPVCFPLPLGRIEGGKHYHVSAKVTDIGHSMTYDAQGNPLVTPLGHDANTIHIEAGNLGEPWDGAAGATC
jgi:hypothetical protein